MVLFCVISVICFLIVLLLLILYKVQIRKICRSLNFYRKNKSNLQITTDINFREINALKNELNLLIDEQRKSENEYKQNDESLKTTITNLSHDIRTPLTSLDGYFQLLTECDDAKEREKYCRIINGRIKSLNEMLEELFTYAKLQDNGYTLEKEKINVNRLLFDTVFSFYDDFKNTGTEPQLEIIESPVYIYGDEIALKRVFQNIIKNALIHINQENKNVKISMEIKENKTEIYFSNSISEEETIDCQMVFDRFYKSDKARSKASTGLGLYIAKQLTVSMGGEISAETDGRNFTVHLVFGVVD